MKAYSILIFTLLSLIPPQVYGQENIAPLLHRETSNTISREYKAYKTTSLSLPFFEDFDQYDAEPDASKWLDRQVYINNTMPLRPISRGVATLDALSQFGKPYDTISASIIRNADSLTSVGIDLSGLTAADSVYLSFFYQAGGIGFTPEQSDSLMLFFRSKTGGIWRKVWSVSDTSARDFRQVLIAITDTNYLYNGFQFRWINKASIGINDDVWNLDYIRMDRGRNRFDTTVSDIAFTQTPSSMLKEYQSMPYRQYLANSSAERAATFATSIRNNFESNQNIPQYGYNATLGSTALGSDAATGLTIAGKSEENISFNTYSSTPAAGHYDRVIFENKFYLQAPSSDLNKANDTIVRQQIFDNYLAYDDGTAEMSYFLNLFPTLPGKIAIEHHLNQADTIRGVAIYFGRQIPLPTSKFFSIEVYENIAYGASTSDKLLYRIENLRPEYQDTINKFWIYKFDKPIPLKAGTFYIGTTQPALSGSDSLYFGLDRNKEGANFAYYNVLNVWSPSLISGALMIRPILGQEISGSGVHTAKMPVRDEIKFWPNPGEHRINLSLDKVSNQPIPYEIFSTLGQIVVSGVLSEGNSTIDIEQLVSGQYILQFCSKTSNFAPLKFIKK